MRFLLWHCLVGWLPFGWFLNTIAKVDPDHLVSICIQLQFEISRLMNLIFSVFQTWIYRLQFKLGKKLENYKNQMQIDREIREKFFWESWHLAVSYHYFLRLTFIMAPFIKSLIILSESCLMNWWNLLKNSCRILPPPPSIYNIPALLACDQGWTFYYLLFLFT